MIMDDDDDGDGSGPSAPRAVPAATNGKKKNASEMYQKVRLCLFIIYCLSCLDSIY